MEWKNLLLSESLSPTQLEINTAKLLKFAFERRGFTIIHNGDFKKTASGGKPDIEIFNNLLHLNIEVTKTTKSGADREFNSIKNHLQDSIKEKKTKKCYCFYISPETFKRNMDSFSLYNRDSDSKIFPMNLLAFNHLIGYIIEHDEKYFSMKDLEKLFLFRLKTTSTDADILEFINNEIIKNPEIEAQVRKLRQEQQHENNRQIEAIMKKIHNMLRKKYAQNPDEAVKEVSKIVFMKMYEEDKELKNPEHENRCTLKRLAEIKKLGQENPLNYVFDKIKKEMKTEEPNSLIFDDNEVIELEDSTTNKVLELMNGKSFVRLDMDIKGRIYELFLGNTMKNTALGQYFTPEEIIRFIINIANLKANNKILDPCCGTGRFLTNAMDFLVDKAQKNEEFTKKDTDKIKKENIYGVDLSKAVFKIARMNMYIHGDGKSNIIKENFITTNPDLKGKFNVILTNPPFGDINLVEDVENFDKYEEQIMNEFPKVERDIGDGEEEHIKSKSYKGGALLIQRANTLLKKEGKLITVIDEGILNTEEYNEFRDYIRENFFIRAIISLPQMTFKRLAKSSPKASILYLIKKNNPLDKQEEPIFFAQVSQVGIDTRGKSCRNDFDLIQKPFNEFEKTIENNLNEHNGIFNKKAFDISKFSNDKNKNWWNLEGDKDLMLYIIFPEELEERIDFTYNRPDFKRQIEMIKKNGYDKISSFLIYGETKKGLTPNNFKDKKKEIPLLTIKNIGMDGKINYKNLDYVSKEYFNHKDQNGEEDRKKQVGVNKNDILIAITGATIGKSAIFEDDKVVGICGDIAKLELKDKNKFIYNFLNSALGQMQIKRAINGSTNFHLSIKDIDKIIIPKFEDINKINDVINDFDLVMKELKEINNLNNSIEKDKKELMTNVFEDNKKLKNYKEKVNKLLKLAKDFKEIRENEKNSQGEN